MLTRQVLFMIFAFIVSFAFTFATTPLVRRFAFKIGAIDILFFPSILPIKRSISTHITSSNALSTPLSAKSTAVIPSTPLIAYNINTVCFWENPISTSLWCKCPLSAVIGLCPRNIRLIIANNASNNGNPKIKSGTANDITA